MEQTRDNLLHDYNLAVKSFDNADYVSFFRNVRPVIEWLSQYLIFDIMDDEEKALDLIDGNALINKNKEDNTYSYVEYPPKFKPTGKIFPQLFLRVYFYKHGDVATARYDEEKKRLKRELDSYGAELCRYYDTASAIGAHAGKTSLSVATQACACAACLMGFLDYIKSNEIVSREAKAFLATLNTFALGGKKKEAEEKEKALLEAWKRTEESNRKLEEQEQMILQLQGELARRPEAAAQKGEGTADKDKGSGEAREPSLKDALKGVNQWNVEEETMDDDQLDLIEYTDDKSMLVAGCAGSGKSVIAMHKAERLCKEGKNVILIAFTKSLRKFMEHGASSFGFYHHYLWKLNGMPKADYIIVDEIQDFTREEIMEFIDAARMHYIFFGDTAQSIYRQYGKQTITMDQIAAMTGLNTLQLYNNYRLPRPVAKITQNYVGVGVQEYKEKVYQNRETELPHFLHLNSQREQMEALLRLANDNEARSMGILLPSNAEVMEIVQYFGEHKVGCEYKYNRGDNDFDNTDNIDFSTSRPKIMTYHSAKGLQFDMVVLPMYKGANNDEARKALYVAMTRTMHKLYVLYSTPQLLPPLNVPSHLYLEE